MRVLFGFGNSQLGQPVIGNHFAQNIGQGFRRIHCMHKTLVVDRIFGHADGIRQLNGLFAGKAAEFGVCQRIKDFPGAVGAEIRHQNGIAVGNSLIIPDNAGNDKFVGYFVCI